MSGENRDPQAGPGIGRSLERARESMGLSLWEVEQETRIRSRYLRDLEREDFDVLPAVYVLGSLKTYADFLGLDGAALSRQLKPSLVEPAEPDAPTQTVVAPGGDGGEDDEYEAIPVPAVGFDQLFLGMGVILISILAVMTLVAAVARGDQSPVSQINQPATPETPSEIALAGNVQEDGDDIREDKAVGRATDDNEQDRPENDPEASEKDEEGEGQSGPQSASPFDGVEFVPMPPSSSTTASASAASASASPAPSSSAPATDAPADTASRSATSAATVPAATAPEDSGVGRGPAGAEPAPAATGSPNGPGPQEAGPAGLDTSSMVDGINAQVREDIGPTP